MVVLLVPPLAALPCQGILTGERLLAKDELGWPMLLATDLGQTQVAALHGAAQPPVP
jgi:hypothetical protein